MVRECMIVKPQCVWSHYWRLMFSLVLMLELQERRQLEPGLLCLQVSLLVLVWRPYLRSMAGSC